MRLLVKIALSAMIFLAFSCGISKPHEFSYYMEKGKIAAGVADYTKFMTKHKVDDKFKAELGLLTLANTFQNFTAAFYLILDADFYHEIGIDIPENKKQQTVTYEHFIEMLSALYDGLEATEKIMSEIEDSELKIPLYIGKYYFDVDQDKKVKAWEWLPNFFKGVLPIDTFSKQELEEFYIGFDYSDILWVRGYCNLIMHSLNFALSYNWSPQFYSFLTPNNFMSKPICTIPPGKEIKLFSFDVLKLNTIQIRNKKRMNAAHEQILKVIELSRLTWESILAEVDDDQEWLPSPNQRSIFFDIAITPDFVDTWHKFLDDAEGVFNGRILIPYKQNQGLYINLKKYYDDPKTFSILEMTTNLDEWLKPYLEEGEIVEAQPWDFFNMNAWLAPLQTRFNNRFLQIGAYVN